MTESNVLAFRTVFLARNPLTDDKVNQMSQWGKKLSDMRLVQGMEGNLSFRTQLGFIISGTGVVLDALTPETVAEITGVVYGLDKTSVYVKGQVVPSRETIMHVQIYEERPEINAIFHVHDTQVMKHAKRLSIPVTSVEQEAGTQELAQEVVNLLKSNKASRYFILKNHGVIALGTTLDEAGKLAVSMSKKAQTK